MEKHKAHPHHKGQGFAAQPNHHWEKKPEETMVADGKYGTEFGAPEELKKSVDGLASYVKKNKMKY